jgi:hypothetical protein
MNKPCRLTNAHQHRTLPRGTMAVYLAAERIAPPHTCLLRVRWMSEAREWQACYVGPA